MDLNAHLRLSAGGFTGPLGAAQGAISSFVGGLKSMVGPLAAITAGIAGVASVGAIFTKSIQAAAADESLEAKLTVLTKSAQTAKGLLADLNQFSDATPFEPEPIMRAGVALVGAKFAAQDVKGVLQDIGDLASSGVGDLSENMNEITSAFARLKSGGSGEALEILRRFSINQVDLAGKGLKFDAGGQLKSSADQAITAVRAIIQERFGGTMDSLSRKTEGLISTLKGNISAVFREFGKPMLEPLKEALSAAIKFSDVLKDKAREWGETIGNSATFTIQLFKDGNLGKAASLALKIGFGEALNYLVGGLKGIFVGSISILRDALKAAMSMDGKGISQFGSGLVHIFKGLGAVIGGEITKTMVEAFKNVKFMGVNLIDQENLGLIKESADSQSQAGASLVAAGSRQLVSAFAGSGDALFASLMKGFDKFKFQVMTTKIVDTTPAQKELKKLSDEASKALNPVRKYLASSYSVDGDGSNPTLSGKAASEAIKNGAKLTEGDRLTKIGLLVGAHQNGLADSARRTAQNTDKMATAMVQLINKMGTIIQNNNPMPGPAVWGAYA